MQNTTFRARLRAHSSRLALGLALAAAAGVAHGQAAADSTAPGGGSGAVAEVTVTGFRASLASALESKRHATDIVDVIKADDIANFPDNNLAEAIQRIPGVSIDRDGGEGRTITVRGLGPDFTRVTVNGIEAQAITGGPDSSGGTNRGRGFDFNVFAAELFQSVTVHKTQSADIEEGSLGATVDLQAARPFDFKGFTFSASAQGSYNDLSKSDKPRLAALISDKFFDDKVGVLISAAYQERVIEEEGYNSTRWDNGPSNGGWCSPVGVTPQNPSNSSANGINSANCAAGDPRLPNTATNVANYNLASASTTFFPRLPSYTRLTYDNKRLGLTGSIQFKPDSRTLFNLDVLYADFKSHRLEDGLSAISLSRTLSQGGKPETSIVGLTVDPATGNAVAATFNGVDFRSSAREDQLDTKFQELTFTAHRDITDHFRADLLVGQSRSDLDNPVQTTVTIDNRNVNGFSYNYANGLNGRLPQLTIPFDPSNPASWSVIGAPTGSLNGNYSEIRMRPQTAHNVLTTERLDLGWDVTRNFTLKAGAAYKLYEFRTTDTRRANQDETITGLPAGVSIADVTTQLTGFGSGLGAGVPSGWVIPDIAKFAQVYNINCDCLQSGAAGGPGDYTMTNVNNGNARKNNQKEREGDTSAYVEAAFRFDTPIGEDLRGDVGVRYVETRLQAIGYQATKGGTEVDIQNRFSDTLPSLNLAWDVTNDFVLRFGAAKVMARPTLTTLNPGGSFSTSSRTVSIGNPYLAPFRAKTYDLSAEWYFAKESLVSVALFYKDIDTYVQQLKADMPFSATGIPAAYLPSNISPSDIFTVTTWLNTPGGPLKGAEVAYQQPFTFLPGPLSHLGTQLNATYVESKISYALSTGSGTTPPVTTTQDLLGLSRWAYNATLYYDDGRTMMRVSAAYRDPYLNAVPGGNNNDVQGKRDTLNIDVSASFKLTPQISLTFQGLNLTDQFNDQYVDSVGDRPSVYSHTGRQFYFGARYRF